MIRIQDLKLSVKEDKSKLKDKIKKEIRIKDEEIISYSIYKESIDARKKNDIQMVYTVDVELKNEDKILKLNKNNKVSETPDISYHYVEKGSKNIDKRPVIVGMGPAGLFCGLILAQMGYKPLILERGKAVEDRARDIEDFWSTGKLNVESNVQFGEGGAGTFSDGKLTTLIKDKRCRKILEEFVEAGAPEEILYKNKPHIGTDILRNVVINIRKKIIELGGEVRFSSKLTDIVIADNKIKSIEINNSEKMDVDLLVLALGHSARDTFEMLHKNEFNIIQKAFSVGVRIEHPQEIIDKSQYGDEELASILGAADYKLAGHFNNGRSAYTFCMCPGGQVVAAASEENRLVTNGMSYHARDKENANSALLVGVTPADFGSDHPLAGVHFQRRLEELAYKAGGGKYKAPVQLVGDFLNDRPSTKLGKVKPSYEPNVNLTDLRECLPDYVVETLKEAIVDFDKKIKGFANPDAIMTGIESRSSSPIRIIRNEEYQSNIAGVYPIGEGAGYAGGIISAAVDGIKIAEQIAKE